MYIVDPHKLEVGDIIMSRDGKIKSRLIRKVLDSEYSHVALYLGNCSLIEATFKGVHTENVLRLTMDDNDSLKVLRLIKPLSEDQKLHLRLIATDTYTAKYSIGGAFITGLNSYFTGDKEKITLNYKNYCSNLIAECYEKIGIEMLPGKDKSLITPKDIGVKIIIKCRWGFI